MPKQVFFCYYNIIFFSLEYYDQFLFNFLMFLLEMVNYFHFNFQLFQVIYQLFIFKNPLLKILHYHHHLLIHHPNRNYENFQLKNHHYEMLFNKRYLHLHTNQIQLEKINYFFQTSYIFIIISFFNLIKHQKTLLYSVHL